MTPIIEKVADAKDRINEAAKAALCDYTLSM